MSIRRTTLVLAAVAATLAPAAAASAQSTVPYDPTNTRSTWSANGPVRSLSFTPDTIYMGGDFTGVHKAGTSQSRTRLAALSDGGRTLTDWHPTVDGRVRDVTALDQGTAGDRVLVGGQFTTANGEARANVVAVDQQGDAIDGFRADTDGEVWSINAVPGGERVLLGGDFTTVDGQSCRYLCMIDRSTGRPVPWSAGVAGGGVRTVHLTDGGTTALVGGRFTRLSGQPREFLGQIDLTTGQPTDFAPYRQCDTCGVLDIATEDNRVYAAIAGKGGGRVASYNIDTSVRRWSVTADGDVQSVDVDNGVLYAGGHFGPTFDGAVRHQLAALDALNGDLQDWAVPFSGYDAPGVWDIHAMTDGLYLAGGFRRVEPSGRARFAVLEPTG